MDLVLIILQYFFILIFVLRTLYWALSERKRQIEYPSNDLAIITLLSALFSVLRWV